MSERTTTIDSETGEVLTNEIVPIEVNSVVAAEINQAVATAKRYPRRRDKEIADEIIGRATLNESIASECMYNIRRGDKDIPGPSIRLAEIIRASYGNIRVATRFVRIDSDDPSRQAVIVEAVCHDMQTNQSEVVFERRSIMTSGKGGKKPMPYGADMTSQTAGAARSIARRNAILAVVPKSLWIEAYHRVIAVLKGDATTLGKRRADMIAAFGRVGVKPADLFAAIGVKDENDITMEHMPQLFGMMTAIKEGENPDSVIGRATADQGGAPATGVRNPLKDDEPQPTGRVADGHPETVAAEVAKGGESANASQSRQDGSGEAVQGKATELPLGDDKRTADAPAKPETAKTAEPSPAKPATAAEYAAQAMTVIEGAGAGVINPAMKAKSADELERWWKKERATRIGFKMTADLMEPLQEAYENKLAELRQASGGVT